MFATVPRGTYGPYTGAGEAGTLAVWVAPKAGASRWYTQALDPQGVPRGEPKQLDGAPGELGLATVKPVGGARKGGALKAKGFVVLFTERSEEQERVGLVALDADGGLVSGPAVLAEPDAAVLWLSAVPTEQGAVGLWATRNGDHAQLFSADLSVKGKAQPTAFTKRARAWQAVPFAGGAAVAWVEAGATAAVSGPVMLVLLDGAGAAKGKPVTLSDTATAELDLDLVVTEAGLVAGWSDKAGAEARVQLALMDPSGKLLLAPRASLPSAGEQTLVDLLAPVQGLGPAYAVWETPGQADGGTRWLDVAKLNSKLEPEARARLRVDGAAETSPELVATTGGVAALTLAEACPKQGKCEEPDLLPTFVRFNSRLELVASEPLRTKEFPRGINLAWGLSCHGEACFALAADTKSPARLLSVELAPTQLQYRPAAEAWAAETPPRLESNQAVAQAEPLSDVAAVPTPEGSLVSWITYFDPSTPYTRRTTPAPDGRMDPVRAVLRVRSIRTDGEAGEPQVISYRARSLGGVAMSAGDPKKPGTLLVWTALDAGKPQVFTTLLGAGGKKASQQMLTRTPGEVTDVAAGYVADAPGSAGGWLVSWVDERHGDPEVYTARIGKGLQRMGPDRRVTNATGAATGISLLPQGDKTWAAWSDARDAAAPGVADIYLAQLKSATGEPVGAQRALAETKGHSHSPVLAESGGAVLVAWIEDGAGAGLRVAKLAADGQPEREPFAIALPDGAQPTALALECTPTVCRGVTSAARGAVSELYAFVLRPPAALVKLRRLGRLDGPSAQSVAPVLQGDQLWFADQREGRGFLRRAGLRWP